MKEKIKVGTVIKDHDKIGIIKRIVKPNTLPVAHTAINLRHNYEIYYTDGVVGYLGCQSLLRLVESGCIELLVCA